MKPATDKGKNAAWTYDTRVRERLIASGALDPKVIEHHLAELPDLDGHAEAIAIAQPAIVTDGSEP